MSDVIGVIGLGVMGSAMSSHIIAAGHDVHGFDTDPDKMSVFGGVGASSIAEVVEHSNIVLLSLPTPAALEAVTAEIIAAEPDGLIVVEMGTLSLEDKMAAQAKLATAGAIMLDAPVSGTGLQAADATLVVYCSGPTDGYERAQPFFDLLSQKSFDLGDFGNGSRMKFVANLLVAVHTLATAEAHGLGAAAGLDPQLVQEVISSGVGSSKIFDIRGPMVAADTYEPPSARLSIILKDIGIIADFARNTGAITPLLDAAIPLYERGKAEGIGDLDAAALRKLL
ncbi:MAG: putative dehydrogenase [Verrucomicrobiales bacterium]|jgi:putative dehydrogenase